MGEVGGLTELVGRLSRWLFPEKNVENQAFNVRQFVVEAPGTFLCLRIRKTFSDRTLAVLAVTGCNLCSSLGFQNKNEKGVFFT